MQVRFLPGSPPKAMNEKQIKTIETYNSMASDFAMKFDRTGARSKDLDRLFEIVNQKNPFVSEIGCAAGRDAEYIIEQTNRYIGIDALSKLIDIARKRNPHIDFETARVEEFKFLDGLDIVHASASLIHVSKDDL